MEIYQHLADWLIPVLLGGIVFTLQSIRSEISGLGKSLAITSTKVEEHDRRIGDIEDAM